MTPNPGSNEALDAGCKCPVIDNGHGRGWRGGVLGDDGKLLFVRQENCPLHGALSDDVTQRDLWK